MSNTIIAILLYLVLTSVAGWMLWGGIHGAILGGVIGLAAATDHSPFVLASFKRRSSTMSIAGAVMADIP